VKKLMWIVTLALIVAALAAACSGGSDAEPTNEPTVESPTRAPTSTSEAPPELPTTEATAYPAPPTPTPPGSDAPYPGFTPQPTIDPYPGGLVTILHPMGIQCEEPILQDLSAAIGALEEAGISVVAAEEVALNVCEACSCPTSVHFQVQINVEDMDKAFELGWSR
jgi:hypothetical protein